MKTLRTCLLGTGGLVLVGGCALAACSSGEGGFSERSPGSGDSDGFADDGGATAGDAAADGAGEPGSDGEGVGGAGGGSAGLDVLDPPEPQQPPAGQLTAGIFDDNLSFSFFEDYRERVLRDHSSDVVPFDWQKHTTAHDAYADAQGARSHLDIALMIDTTGSMGDELSYLQSEFVSISDSIAETYPNALQRWGLVVYRDQGDEYVVRGMDFVSDLKKFQESLLAQSHGGGGDYPEAPQEGLRETNGLSWRAEEDVARLVFWVADAPHHPQDGQAMAAEIADSRDQNIHIYPVASSGVDEVTEFSMRAAAQITHGRYLFLTNDSGIGNDHKEPTLPCYYVTLLRDAMLRAVDAEMTGEVDAPTDDQLIRLGGRLYENGFCAYGDGDEARPF